MKSFKAKFKWKKFLKNLGPGFITGASDDDPSGIGTYSQTGAQFGYSQLWIALFSFPFMTIIQEICGRIGIVTGKGLGANIKENFPRSILYFSVTVLLIANSINIGADLGAMASSAQLLLGLPFTMWLLIMTVFILTLEVFVSYRVYTRVLKYLAISLLSYIIVAFLVKQNWSQIALSTLIPHIEFSKEYIFNIVALLGTTISPYLFFWQTNEEVEEEIEKHKLNKKEGSIPKIAHNDIHKMRIDTFTGMFFSQIVMFFIIITTASTLHISGLANIETANQAAEALRPLAGDFTFVLFAAGIIGTGLLSVPVLAGSASYAISETLNIKAGLYQKLKKAHGFYGIITIATLAGLLINFTPIQPFQLLYYTAILNGIVAPPLMVLIMLISRNKKIMGEHANSKFSNVTGWIITGVMSAASIFLIISLVI